MPVLTKHFIIKGLFLSLAQPQFLLVYPNFEQLILIKYMKISNETFSQSCKFWIWGTFAAEVLSMSRNHNWSFLGQNKTKSFWQVSSLLDLSYIHRKQKQTWLLVGHRHPGLVKIFCEHVKDWTQLETSQMGKLVQHH